MSTETDVLGVVDFEIALPCEANEHWHTTDDPAIWATWWDFECGCKNFLLLCESCMEKVQATRRKKNNTRCSTCGLVSPGNLYSHLLRQERIR